MKKSLLLTLVLLGTISYADTPVSYKKCSTCHGINGEKVALGKSKIIKDMTKTEIEASLNGYKNGVGGPMKNMMIPQVKDISENDIKEIANYIGK